MSLQIFQAIENPNELDTLKTYQALLISQREVRIKTNISIYFELKARIFQTPYLYEKKILFYFFIVNVLLSLPRNTPT